jgi:hypothetical protein
MSPFERRGFLACIVYLAAGDLSLTWLEHGADLVLASVVKELGGKFGS